MTTTQDIYKTSSDFEDMRKLDQLFPNLGYIITATLAQGADPTFVREINKFRNEKSKVLGRSNTNAPAPKAEEMLGEAEKFYTRPNGDKYFTRKWGKHTDVLVVQKARETNQYILAYGAPGCGKTAMFEAAFGEELETILGSGDTEVADLVGGYVMNEEGGFSWVDGPLIRAMVNGAPLLIDEVGIIDPKVLTIAYGAMDGRRELTVTANPERGTVKAADGFFVIAATNPNAPGVNLSEALLSRFTIHVEMTTDWDLARTLGVPTKIVTVAQNLDKKRENDEVSWGPQFRELLAFRDVSKAFGQEFAIANLLASAPEIDRPLVSDVVRKAFGDDKAKPAKI